MSCEQFGQQACTENDRTADRIGLSLDQDDPRQAADLIRQELYDRPQPLQIDLLDRIQHYDEKGRGADLRIEPLIREVRSPYGGYEYVDTGDREVVVQSQYGRDQVAIITGNSQGRWNQIPDRRQLDPLMAITSLFVGNLLDGQFRNWMDRPHHRQHWQDRGGQMWYPQPGGSWGNQYRGPSGVYNGRSGQQDPRRFYDYMEQPNQGGRIPGQSRWPQQGSPEWMRRQRQGQGQQDGRTPGRADQPYNQNNPNWRRDQQTVAPQGNDQQIPRRGQDDRVVPAPGNNQGRQHWRGGQDNPPAAGDHRQGHDQTRPRIPETPPAGRQHHRFDSGKPHIPEGQPPRARQGDQQVAPKPAPPARVAPAARVEAPARVAPARVQPAAPRGDARPHAQPGGDTRRNR